MNAGRGGEKRPDHRKLLPQKKVDPPTPSFSPHPLTPTSKCLTLPRYSSTRKKTCASPLMVPRSGGGGGSGMRAHSAPLSVVMAETLLTLPPKNKIIKKQNNESPGGGKRRSRAAGVFAPFAEEPFCSLYPRGRWENSGTPRTTGKKARHGNRLGRAKNRPPPLSDHSSLPPRRRRRRRSQRAEIKLHVGGSYKGWSSQRLLAGSGVGSCSSPHFFFLPPSPDRG